MHDPYAILGVTDASTDSEIRQAYLEAIRRHPPEQDAEKFATIRQAFELIQTIDQRVRFRFFEIGEHDSLDDILQEAECLIPRPRFGLRQLLDSVRK